MGETCTFLPEASSSLSSVFTGYSSRRTRSRTDASTPRYAFFNHVLLVILLRLGLVPRADDQVATQKGTMVGVTVRTSSPTFAVQMDHPIWPKLSDPKPEVWVVVYVLLSTRRVLISSSYISEAAASLLDRRLEMYIVPRTGLVSLSSQVCLASHTTKTGDLMRPQAFFYDWIDRTAFKKGKPLPDKIGSLQCFLNGYTGAFHFRRSDFLSEPLS